jgi:hypothetical protein
MDDSGWNSLEEITDVNPELKFTPSNQNFAVTKDGSLILNGSFDVAVMGI